jgi:NADH dehydrogenase
MSDQPRVVILGVGFGGIAALKKLDDPNIKVTIIDKRDYHTFQPLLYQVATDELAPSEVGFPIRELLHGRKNIAFRQALVRSVNLARKEVVAEGIDPVHYDYLILALGGGREFLSDAGRGPTCVPALHNGRCDSAQGAHPQDF